MNMLTLTALLVAVATSASASPVRAAEPPSTASDCIQLGSDQQIVRAGAVAADEAHDLVGEERELRS